MDVSIHLEVYKSDRLFNEFSQTGLEGHHPDQEMKWYSLPEAPFTVLPSQQPRAHSSTTVLMSTIID